jgi:hypothetical protein
MRDYTHQWFYVPDLGVWEQLHAWFVADARLRDDSAELALLGDILPNGAIALGTDLGGNYVIEEASGRITYFDCSQYYRRYEPPHSSSVYPLAPSREAWSVSLRDDAVLRVGSRAWRLAFVDGKRQGGTRREEMWSFPELDRVECLARTGFLEFAAGEYAI